METTTIVIVPYLFVDRPQILLVHHLSEGLHQWHGRRTIFGVEAINTTAAVRSSVFVVLHWVYLFVRAAVMHTVTLRLHLITTGAIQFHDQFLGTIHLCALIG